ncbi:MAG: SGNH/GDSL hydrolase family protein [Bacteroidota bacterium]
MKYFLPLLSLLALACGEKLSLGIARPETYLKDVKEELLKQWPHNKTINLVFHGHSVPAGYFQTPDVKTLEAYPHQFLELLKAEYPTAVVNVITTAIGGENAASGTKRFQKEVLNHQPDVLFIDYALNDRNIGLEAAYKAWEEMIRKAKAQDIPVILLTPTPDLQVNILEPDNDLQRHSDQIEQLAEKHGLGLVDSYEAFKLIAQQGEDLQSYMSQSNHPNSAGHRIVAKEIMKYFR